MAARVSFLTASPGSCDRLASSERDVDDPGRTLMSRKMFVASIIAAGLSVAGSALAADAGPARPDDLFGVWRNPKGSVHIEIKPCGPGTCGYVVWANAEAQADVKKGSNQGLVGMQLLRDFSVSGANEWKGKVFVPDLNMTFSGQVRLLNRASLRAKGCLLPNFLCKSQVWTRVETAAVTGRTL
ncbi:DUF2147 domain-containing protein [Caulobacter vibrioides]|uniref:DUF2147 domain-containing protein n=1 Tax=Caulobacter vibrioides TaxID=155892 RepID=UPI000BB4BCFB|nr:DUF2147 domain-containing protein [Caulobacter vibrioides]ATC24644.1 DUF2147 domain-containing protein [Caulobacter vibrioides]AZH12783.1 DUF2147 domain-containing protein [Caulobacter vibrioides]PLR09419.1 DUF2147 domain-containing protein [Caulobacter vibrioides]